MKRNKTIWPAAVALIILLSGNSTESWSQQKQSFVFRNQSRSFDERVDDLVQQLTLDEKIGQMMNNAPGVDRLGIPAYNWWNECLHGVARTFYKVTVYPQAIAMAATFDAAAIRKMAYQTAMEGRAIYTDCLRRNSVGMYTGLTYWTPNVNIFRDPRWGRGQETYGEDPCLTKTMGMSFVEGVQGNDKKYLLAAACAKHYAVHSGPEHNRHQFNTTVSAYDLWDTYLPAFHDLVVKAKVAGVMCAYNAYAGQPCCGSDLLMQHILRDQWQFKGYVTSDCGGIRDFYSGHKTSANAAVASASAVIHGTDVECGTAYKALKEAVASGLVKEEMLNQSLKRLFMVRFRLGMFDEAPEGRYARVPLTVLEQPSHQTHALTMARESMVLLRNHSGTLPLSKSIGHIAVVGPNANDAITVLGNYNGFPSKVVTPLEAIRARVPKAQVTYLAGCSFTGDAYTVPLAMAQLVSGGDSAGLYAEYFTNKNFEGKPAATAWEPTVQHNWSGGEPLPGNIAAANTSMRWTGVLTPDSTQQYVFEVGGDDAFRLLIDGKKVLDRWREEVFVTRKYEVTLEKGKKYQLQLEHYQVKGGCIQFSIGVSKAVDVAAVAATAGKADAIVFIGGITSLLEGEEMGVNLPGFYKGDRTTIQLPEIQTKMLQALEATGKPVIFVLETGSAIAIPWEAANIPAIINAWYGGEAAGTAIADILFGDYNPSGRLPVTFYKQDSDLPDFEDYSMKNRTYRYFEGTPLYGFGYGLSYTTFEYCKLQMPARVPLGRKWKVRVTVTNTGKRDGDEVVQLYLSHKGNLLASPIRALKCFSRIALRKGETRTVTFILTPEMLSLVNEAGILQQHPGIVQVAVGGAQPGTVGSTSGNGVSGNVQVYTP